MLDRFVEIADRAEGAVSGDDLLAILDAMPDGWQRRRAALRLLDGGRVQDVDVTEVLGRFGQEHHRAAVAAALVAARLTDVETLRPALSAAMVARLARRVAARRR